MSRLGNVIRKFWESFVGFAEMGVPKGSSLESDARGMLSELDRHADAVSFRMARADEAKDKLQRALENYEALGKQAEAYMREGNEPFAQRTVVLQLEANKEISALQQEYQALQQEAETHAAAFIAKRNEVTERVKTLPQLQRDARLIKADEEINRLSDKFNLDAAKNQFDKMAEEIRIKKLQLANRQLLTADPNAELDAKIRSSLQDREVEEAMKALAERVKNAGDVVDAEFSEDPALAARKLLDAPRYSGILQIKRPEKVKIPANRP